ncbi:hypothetical protein D9M68_737520 [compost metagenome]
MPFKPGLFPVFKPFFVFTRTNKKLHFHLLKFTHPHDKLAGNYFIPEGLTDLGNTERNFHPAGLLYVQKIHKNALCCFRTKVYLFTTLGHGTKLCAEHQVKLAYIGPVLCSAYRTGNFVFFY